MRDATRREEMSKKELKRLLLILQSAYMFQFYVLQGKTSCKFLQAHECIDIRVRKLKEQLWDICVEFHKV